MINAFTKGKAKDAMEASTLKILREDLSEELIPNLLLRPEE